MEAEAAKRVSKVTKSKGRLEIAHGVCVRYIISAVCCRGSVNLRE